MGYGDAGYLSTGSAHGSLLTPHLDRMVQEGMSFTEAYAGAPVCAPSRCTLITGRHSGHCTVRSNGPTLHAADVGFPTVLRNKANYHTRHIGKWGLGGWGTGGRGWRESRRCSAATRRGDSGGHRGGRRVPFRAVD